MEKTMYRQGDYIWYGMYLTNGITHQLNPISKIAYIELINPKGQIQEKKTLVLEDGRISCYFVLHENVKGGLYKIRAYTMWMKNFSNPAIFEKQLVVQKVITPNLLLKIDFEISNFDEG